MAPSKQDEADVPNYQKQNIILFVQPDAEFELTKKSQSFIDKHQKNKALHRELQEAVQDAENEARVTIEIDKTICQQMSLNSSGDYVLSKKGRTLEEIHHENLEEQKNIIHEIELLKKHSIMMEAQEAAHDEKVLLELDKIEEKHKVQKEKQQKIIQDTKDEITSMMQNEKTFSQQLCLNSSGDYVMTKKIQALENLHSISKEEQQKLLDEIEVMKQSSMMQEAKDVADNEETFHELDKIMEDH